MSEERKRPTSRPVRKWLAPSSELDQIAQRRLLMVLSVLSGEKLVSEAIVPAEISRGHYYLLEERALKAMLEALAPGAPEGRPPEASLRIAELEKRAQQLLVEKRRAEKLLELTRKMLPKGPYKVGPGRPRRSSTPSGKRASPSQSASPTELGSTPTGDGASARSSGRENSPAPTR